jgi:hypothetical protein
MNPVWKILWKLKIPSKVRNFIWRALHGILPLKCILANRHIGDSGECPICHKGAEDVLHLLFQCPAAKTLWSCLNLDALIDTAIVVDRSGSAVLEYLLRLDFISVPGIDSIKFKELLPVACWYLWWLQRKRSRGEDVPPIHKCKFSILSIVANAAAATKPPRPNDVKWIKPIQREVKVNIDASFFQESSTGAVGAVLRDYHGKFCGDNYEVLTSCVVGGDGRGASYETRFATGKSNGKLIVWLIDW